jgi:hypothetical protein
MTHSCFIDLIASEEPISCELTLQLNWARLVLKSGIYEMYKHDPVSGLQRLIIISKEWEKGVWCDTCASKYQDAWKDARDRIWRKLDDLLELNPCDDSA